MKQQRVTRKGIEIRIKSGSIQPYIIYIPYSMVSTISFAEALRAARNSFRQAAMLCSISTVGPCDQQPRSLGKTSVPFYSTWSTFMMVYYPTVVANLEKCSQHTPGDLLHLQNCMHYQVLLITTICKRYSDSNERIYIYIHTVIMFCSRQNTWGASCCPSVGVYLPSSKSSIHLHLPISTINSLSYKLYSYQFI